MLTAADRSGGKAQGDDSARERGSATARAGYGGIDVRVPWRRSRFGARPNHERNMERSPKCGCNDLRKRGTFRTPGGAGQAGAARRSGTAVGLEGMAKFMNHGAVLSGEQQQQQPE